jgi:multidrug efflux pump subunit AcrB
MKPTMIDNKDASTKPADEIPTYIVTSACEKDQSFKKSGVTKRHVLYAVSAVLVIAIVLVAILVGVYMFTESQKEITKFTLQLKGRNNEDIKEEVESDPNDNVVQHHVTQEGKHVYIVNDFNRGMQVVKITEDGESECYVTALNRSAAQDPPLVTGSDKVKIKDANDTYTTLNDPVVDRSFLTKKALNLCKDVPLNWIVKYCDTQNDADVNDKRVKRLSGLFGCSWKFYCWWIGCRLVLRC